MNLKDFNQNLQKVKETKELFVFSLLKGADNLVFEKVEKKLGVSIPEKTKEFYKFHNGFKTHQPHFELLPVENWTSIGKGKIHFATFDNEIKIYFESSKINSANQWSINTQKTDYEITLSMRSFWSNKIWHWLRSERTIWKDEFWK